MIVGMKILDQFDVEDANELIEQLRDRKLLNFTLDEVKEKVKKEWKMESDFDWETMSLESDVLDFILAYLANGFYSWDYNDNSEDFTITVVDQTNPYFSNGKEPNDKEKVAFT